MLIPNLQERVHYQDEVREISYKHATSLNGIHLDFQGTQNVQPADERKKKDKESDMKDSMSIQGFKIKLSWKNKMSLAGDAAQVISYILQK